MLNTHRRVLWMLAAIPVRIRLRIVRDMTASLDFRKVVSTPQRNRATFASDAKTPLKTGDSQKAKIKLVCVDAHFTLPMEASMRVRVWQEGRYGELGETRWAVSWYTITAKGQRRCNADQNYEVDFDSDLDERYAHFKTKEAAQAYARKVVASGCSFFGVAMVVKEVLDWMSEDDMVGCFEETSEHEEVAA